MFDISPSPSASKIKLHIHNVPRIEDEWIKERHKVRNYYSEKRREPIVWTDDEIKALEEGVGEFGLGKWKVILGEYKNRFHTTRIPSDLSSKHRLMSKKGSYYSSKKINFVEINDDGEVMCDVLGEYRVYYSKFPHEAAVKAGKFKLFRSGEETNISIQGRRNGVITRHKYRVFEKGGKIRAKKLFSEVVRNSTDTNL